MKKERQFWLHIVFIALILIVYSKSYAEVYRYVDKNGVWHFTNRLIPGSQYKLSSPRNKTQDCPTSSVTPKTKEILAVQVALESIGYNPGEIDGIWGKRTEDALKRFQEDTGLQVNGQLDGNTKQRLNLVADGEDVGKTPKRETNNQGGISLPSPPSSDGKSKLHPTVATPQYTVVSKEDVSYAEVLRKSYRVRVPREMTRDQLTTISKEIVHRVTSHEKIKAIMIFYYLPSSDTNGAFTAGKAIWAPKGDWSKSSTDFSPILVVEQGGAMGTISRDNIVELPISKKKQVFRQIVRNQDLGMDDEESHSAAARQFGITTDQAKKISLEGIIKGWRMP